MGFREYKGEAAPNCPRPACPLPGGRMLSLRCRKTQVLTLKHPHPKVKEQAASLKKGRVMEEEEGRPRKEKQ